MGCGIACVAIALKKSYKSTKKLFDNPEYASTRGYYCRELVKVLNKFDNYVFAKASEKNDVLLALKGEVSCAFTSKTEQDALHLRTKVRSFRACTYKNLLNRNGTIVFIERSKKYPAGHYLVKTEKGWMNSWINFPNISPTKSGFQKVLPGKAQWIIYQKR